MTKKLAVTAICLVISLAASLRAEVILTTAVGNGADTYVGNDSLRGPNNNYGTGGAMDIRYLAATRAHIGYVRFDLTGIAGDMTGARFQMFVTSANAGRTWSVYGLIDNAADDAWGETTVTYNTIPGLLPTVPQANGNYTIDTTKLTLLGTLAVPNASNVLVTSTTTALPLDAFLAADTNNLVTLVLIDTTGSGKQWYVATKEGAAGDTTGTQSAPKLILPNALPPGASYPQPAEGSTIIDLSLNQLCWKNNGMDQYKVWFGPADANESNYTTRLSLAGTVDDPAVDTCFSIPAAYLPLTAPVTYSWAVEGYVYPESDPNHVGEPNQLITTSVWHFLTSARPTTVSGPANQYKDAAESASFSAVFQALTPVLDAVWYKDGAALSTSDPDIHVNITNGSGNLYTVTLTIDNVQIADDGTYYCIARNSGGYSPESSSAYLVIKRMLAHWAFDGNAADETGVYNGTLMGEPNFVIDGTRQAMQFDGVDDYVDLPDGFANFQSGLTFSMWVNPTTGTNYSRFIDLGNGAPSDNVFFTRAGTTSWLHFEVYTGTVSGGFVSLGSGTLTEGTWQFFTVTLAEDGNAILYKNGVPIATASGVVLPNVVTRTNNFIGNTSWTYPLYNGLIDDIKVYNYPLTDEQIAVVYADTAGDFCRYRPTYDFNDDCTVNLGDFAVFAAGWLNCGLHPDTACY